MERLNGIVDSNGIVSARLKATQDALAGMTEEALECLERSVRHGLTQIGWFANDANLDGLRGHPRFRKLMARLEQVSADAKT